MYRSYWMNFLCDEYFLDLLLSLKRICYKVNKTYLNNLNIKTNVFYFRQIKSRNQQWEFLIKNYQLQDLKHSETDRGVIKGLGVII